MPIKTDRQYRAMSLLAPATTNKRIESDYYAEGYATTFDVPYLLWEYEGNKYYEVVDRHALDSADMSDVIMQFDHAGRVFARLTNKTLGLEIDDHGLFTFADLSKSNAARDMYGDISSGLITKMSWAFTIDSDNYDRATRTYTILKVKKVFDVSAVSCPANSDTEISARSRLDGVIQAELQERQARELALKKALYFYGGIKQ